MEEVSINQTANSFQWSQFRYAVESEGWVSDDHSVLTLLPNLPSTRTEMAVDKDGNFIGAVVWNEYDEMAFIGFYIVKAEARGRGIGTNLWNRAIKRIGIKLTALRAVPRMLPKYEARGFPIRGRQLYKYFLPASKLIPTFSALVPEHQTQHIVSFSEVNQQQRTALYAYDKYVTGRDRSQFLQLFMNHEQVRGKILLSATGEIIGYSAIVPTGLPERRLYKLAPLYADQLCNAVSLALCILREHQEENKDSEIVILTIEDSIGSEQLNPIIEDAASITAQQGGVTLFNADPFPSMRMLYAKCYIPHNNSSHYDA